MDLASWSLRKDQWTFQGLLSNGIFGKLWEIWYFHKWEVHRLDGDSERLFFVFSGVVENQKQFMIVA